MVDFIDTSPITRKPAVNKPDVKTVRSRALSSENKKIVEGIADQIVVSKSTPRSVVLQIARAAWMIAQRSLREVREIADDLARKLQSANDRVVRLEKENRMLRAGGQVPSHTYSFAERKHMNTLHSYGLSLEGVARHFGTTAEVVNAIIMEVRDPSIRLDTRPTVSQPKRSIDLK